MTRNLDSVSMDKIVSLAKRRGFIFQSSEIYGGLSSVWDYGPLGVELKRNVKDQWWRSCVLARDDMVGLDAAILMHPQVWVASGHAETFIDPLVECRACNERFRPDQVNVWELYGEKNKTDIPDAFVSEKFGGSSEAELVKKFTGKGIYSGGAKQVRKTFQDFIKDTSKLECPFCGEVGKFTEPRMFNLMLKTVLGPVEDSAHQVYMRPETAQGIFVNFLNVQTATRRKLPFGIAQIGKSFRNEITPGNFTFRTREFEQMEIEFFVKPGTDEDWHQRWLQERFNWYINLGMRKENLRIRQHEKDELAHYAKATYDIEYKFPWGWGELEGIANRTDFDLRQHAKFSGQDLRYYDDDSKEHYLPYVIEPSGGCDRSTLAFLIDAYDEEMAPTSEKGKEDSRVVLHLHPAIAPIKVAVLPLSRNEKLVPKAREVYDMLRKEARWPIQYDDAQSIGRRYRRQDEIGTPLCITIDFQTVETDNAVTIRERDSMKQDRVPIPELLDITKNHLGI